MMPTNQNPPPGSPAGGSDMTSPAAAPPPGGAGGGDLGAMVSARAAQLTPQDMGALQAAPEAIDAIKKLLPEIGPALDTIVGAGGTTNGAPPATGPDDATNSGMSGNSPSPFQRASTRLAQM